MARIARVAIASNLPQLDKLFDYQIPEAVSAIFVGSRVKVPFGRSTKSHDGFVIEISDSSEFSGQLASILEVVGIKPPLTPTLIQTFLEIASRSASSLGEILKVAVPAHMPRAFLAHRFDSAQNKTPGSFSTDIDVALIESLRSGGARLALLAKPGTVRVSSNGEERQFPYWVTLFAVVAMTNLREGKSTILAVPDFRDYEVLMDALRFLGSESSIAGFAADQTKSKFYENYLRTLDDVPRIIVGPRTVILSPAHNLGTVAIFDEADPSFTEQSAPYLIARESALVRQSIESHSLLFASHSRSTEVQRLVESGYLQESTQPFSKPKVSVSEPGFRLDSHAYRAIKEGLNSGSVLVQVASKGESTALFCSYCGEKVLCVACSGPIWVDSSGLNRCRWCNALHAPQNCKCGSNQIQLGRAGATRTASELGRSFPNSKVIESTGENMITRIPQGNNLVIATAGAEPILEGGYRAVVLLDAQTLLAKQFLRASEEAIRTWSNAVAKVAPDGESVLVGVAGALAQKFCLWQQAELASEELAARRELLLPPAIRLGSAYGTQLLLVELSTSLSSHANIRVLGPSPIENKRGQNEWRLIFKYNYSDTVDVAKLIRGESIRLSKGRAAVSASGRAVRAIKVRMYDGDVV